MRVIRANTPAPTPGSAPLRLADLPRRRERAPRAPPIHPRSAPLLQTDPRRHAQLYPAVQKTACPRRQTSTPQPQRRGSPVPAAVPVSPLAGAALLLDLAPAARCRRASRGAAAEEPGHRWGRRRPRSARPATRSAASRRAHAERPTPTPRDPQRQTRHEERGELPGHRRRRMGHPSRSARPATRSAASYLAIGDAEWDILPAAPDPPRGARRGQPESHRATPIPTRSARPATRSAARRRGGWPHAFARPPPRSARPATRSAARAISRSPPATPIVSARCERPGKCPRAAGAKTPI